MTNRRGLAAMLLALAERGAVIGEILVKVSDVFDPSDPREDNRIYRTANALHYKTRGYALDPVPGESRFQIVVETKHGF